MRNVGTSIIPSFLEQVLSTLLLPDPSWADSLHEKKIPRTECGVLS